MELRSQGGKLQAAALLHGMHEPSIGNPAPLPSCLSEELLPQIAQPWAVYTNLPLSQYPRLLLTYPTARSTLISTQLHSPEAAGGNTQEMVSGQFSKVLAQVGMACLCVLVLWVVTG